VAALTAVFENNPALGMPVLVLIFTLQIHALGMMPAFAKLQTRREYAAVRPFIVQCKI
jgi:hypothetical protein